MSVTKFEHAAQPCRLLIWIPFELVLQPSVSPAVEQSPMYATVSCEYVNTGARVVALWPAISLQVVYSTMCRGCLPLLCQLCHSLVSHTPSSPLPHLCGLTSEGKAVLPNQTAGVL